MNILSSVYQQIHPQMTPKNLALCWSFATAQLLVDGCSPVLQKKKDGGEGEGGINGRWRRRRGRDVGDTAVGSLPFTGGCLFLLLHEVAAARHRWSNETEAARRRDEKRAWGREEKRRND